MRRGRGSGFVEGRDDDELVGVGDEHPLDGVGVVGGAAQHRLSRGDAHDPGEAAVGAGRVADEVHLVADDDALAAQLPGPHREDDPAPRPVLDVGRVAPAVHAGDPARHGVGVRGPVLAAGPRVAPGRADPDVGLVVVARRPGHQAPATTRSDSIRPHSVVNSGIVLATVPTSSTTTPGTARPSTAAAMTMRWSA